MTVLLRARRSGALLAAALCMLVSAGYVSAQPAAHATAKPASPAAKTQYRIGPPPAWVEVTPPAKAQPVAAGAADTSVLYLLLDRQLRINDSAAQYVHVAVQLLNQAGVEDESQLQIGFDPLKDRLQVHAVTLRRGAIVIDQLKAGRIEVLQRESSLESGILDGQLTFHLLLNDVRVGDLLEYSYTVERQSPEWGKRQFRQFTTRWDNALRHSRLRVWAPAGAPLYVANHDGLEATRQVIAGWQRLEWQWDDLPAIPKVSDVPAGVAIHPSIEVSQFANWQEVAAAAVPLYALPAQESPERAALVARFRAAGASDAERALAAVRFVQEDIRYTGIELGEGAYRPRSPEQVLAQRFGDCKDKTLLAVALLRSLGIEAAPALVSTVWAGQLHARLPSPGLMNHVIVRARIAGVTYWFDVTATAQGGDLAHYTQSDLGEALVVAPDTVDLQAIPAPTADLPLLSTTEIFDLRDGLDQPARLSVSTLYRGPRADEQRRRLRTTTTTELGQQYLNYYRSRYANIKATGLPEVRDDLLANELKVNESYQVEHLFAPDQGGRVQFAVEAESVASLLRAPEQPVRTLPLALGFPVHVLHHIEIRMPEDWPIQDEVQLITAAGFRYDSHVSRHGDDIHLEYRYRTLADQVPVAKLAEFLEKREQARLDTGYTLSYNPASSVTKEQLEQARQSLLEAARLATRHESDKAQAVLESLMASPAYKALDIEKRHDVTYLAAAIAGDRREWPKALALLQQSTVMAPADADEWQQRIVAALMTQNHADATQSLAILAQRWPRSLAAVDDRVVARTYSETPRTGSGRYVLLKALADARYERRDGADLSSWWCDLGLRQLERGEPDAAAVTLRRAISAEAVIQLLADNRYAPVRERLKVALDVAAAAQGDIDRARAAASRKPAMLGPVAMLADAQITARQFAAALQVLDSAIARVRQGSAHGGFGDYDERFVWILDTRSRALHHLGRDDEALAQLIEASHIPEGESGNVSQVINLAGLYNDLHRPREALAALAGLGSTAMSDYGRMQAANETLRSALLAGDHDSVAQQLAYLSEHRQDSTRTTVRALTLAGSTDEAAQLLISRLADVDERASALVEVQHYATGALTPVMLGEQRGWQALLARPDVAAAIARVGVVGSYPILGEGF